MISLGELLAGLPVIASQPDWQRIQCTGLVSDSRQVKQGDLLISRQPVRPSGQDWPLAQRAAIWQQMQTYLDQAATLGACAILLETDQPQQFAGFQGYTGAVPVLALADLGAQAGEIAQRFYQARQPVRLPAIAAVTGTNGKTTVCRLLAELVSLSGQAAALLGTTGNGILPHLQPATHTTPDALTLQALLHQFAVQGASAICLEASSHGLDQGRLNATPITVALFTNLSRDHLDYHPDETHYGEAKRRLFAWPGLQCAVVNADDPTSDFMLQAVRTGVTVWRYSSQPQQAGQMADFYVERAAFALDGARLVIRTPQGWLTVHSPLLGRFNVSNLLAAVAGGMALGLTLAQLQAAIPQLQGAPGRMQVIADPGRLLVVDYAHTPDAVTQVLTSLRPHVTGRLHCLLGCGGDRDRGKRPLMTQAALQGADRVWLTADNPRSEAVEAILQEMQQGLTDEQQAALAVETDRRQAIRQAVAALQPGDALIVAGKGHEDYQEINGVRHWFDDAIEVAAARD